MADVVCSKGSSQIEGSEVWQMWCVQKVAVR